MNFTPYFRLWNFFYVYPINCCEFNIFHIRTIKNWCMDGCNCNECFIQYSLCSDTNLTYSILPGYSPLQLILTLSGPTLSTPMLSFPSNRFFNKEIEIILFYLLFCFQDHINRFCELIFLNSYCSFNKTDTLWTFASCLRCDYHWEHSKGLKCDI